jgi:membrane associated rhomboid family serine protease
MTPARPDEEPRVSQQPDSYGPDPEPRAAPPRAPAFHERRLRALPVIVGLNALVFLAWLVAGEGSQLWSTLAVNFMVSTIRLQHGLWWTLLTAAFSHQELWHFLLNMVVLWSFGSVLERLLGSRMFLVFYLVSAVFSSASHCLVSSFLLGDDRISALGASGAVSAVLIAFSLAFPRHKILLFGIVPIPALVGAALFVAIDLWGLFAQTRGAALPIGHGAHLGGALCGAVLWALLLRGRRRSVTSRPREVALSVDEVAAFDRIRAKLDSEGPQALTPKERAFLQQLRDRALGDDR